MASAQKTTASHLATLRPANQLIVANGISDHTGRFAGERGYSYATLQDAIDLRRRGQPEAVEAVPDGAQSDRAADGVPGDH